MSKYVEEEIEESEDEDKVDEEFDEFNEEEFGVEFAKNVMNDNNN
ncbi:3339_t:CDS:2 [Diversispora eburnea]|uniref:3339_t:CDS:1 n=1 Tax=Diversispora eburnea TaxID=1213867 RepID=A0A9N9FKM7_9GLOM|nr:3339_t:CDS:2 [Diversispora eburnea]